MQLVSQDRDAQPNAGAPVLALGFRPFYLLAAAFATAALPLWLAMYTGGLGLTGYLSGVAWHNHEMLFGFAPAVVAGFLLTAVRNWTGLPTLNGAALGALATTWILARLLIVTGPAPAAAVVDVLFLPLLGIAIAVPIWRSRNARNVKILAVVAVLAALNAVLHLAYLGYLSGSWAATAMRLGLDLLTLLMAIVGGRVIPVFTANAIAGARPRRVTVVEFAAFGTLLLILAGEAAGASRWLPAGVWIAVLALSALAHALRLALWEPVATRSNALLAMLPVAYGWIPVSLALRALGAADIVAATAATHALTIGAMGSLMLAMMMRSALGHTGRALAAGRSELAAFVLLQLAVLARVLGVVMPAPYLESVILSGLLWSLAFAVFLLRYAPILTRPRVDGKPG